MPGGAGMSAMLPGLAWLRTALTLAWLALCSALLPAHAQDVLPVPELTARVVDQSATLDPGARQVLEAQLAALERDTGTQVAVLMVPTTAPEDIFSYANRVANTWKIGRRDVGDGVLIVVAKDDRRVRIEVAKTLEGAIPDLRARQIIDEAITPAFRRGDFAGGLGAAVDRIGALVRGEALPPPREAGQGAPRDAGFDFFELLILLFIAVPVAGGVLRRIFGRPLGSVVAGGAVGFLAYVVTTSLVIATLAALVGLFVALVGGMGGPGGGLGGRGVGRHRGWGGVPPVVGGWGGGHRGGGGFGGGFGSGGGGDFGGGGASGGW